MFENLKEAQRSGMTPRERRRFLVLLVGMVVLGGAILGMRSCKSLPGRKELPKAADPVVLDPAKAAADRKRLRDLVKDDGPGQAAFQPQAIEAARTLQALGVAEAPQPMTTRALAALPLDDAVGHHVEVEGRVTAMVHVEHRSELETLWVLVLEGADGGQALALRVGATREPGAGVPTDAWPLMPVELQVGDRVLARGIVVQRRSGTVGEIALSEPAPALLCSRFRRQVDPPADPIEDLSEAAFDKIDDRFIAGTTRLDDPAIYEVLNWLQSRGHAWAREQIASGKLKVADWGSEAFDLWSAEAGLRSASQARPFTDKARGQVFRTSGYVAKVLLDDWDAVRPNPWGVNQLRHLYLLSDYYGNSAIPCVSPFPWETFGVADWHHLDQRVWVYGVFVKNHTYDTNFGDGEGGRAKLTMPFFVVLDVKPYPMSGGGGAGWVAIVLVGMVVFAGLAAWLLRRGEAKEDAAWRARQRRWDEERGRTPAKDPGTRTATSGPSAPPQPPGPDDA
jgi:hypothetical protein